MDTKGHISGGPDNPNVTIAVTKGLIPGAWIMRTKQSNNPNVATTIKENLNSGEGVWNAKPKKIINETRVIKKKDTRCGVMQC